MKVLLVIFGLTLILGAAALAQEEVQGEVQGEEQEEEKEEERSVWDGVYTQMQADEGKRLFTQSCVACHATVVGQVAGHGPAPAIVGDAFAYRWTDTTVADLLDTIRQTMPEAAPNSLSTAEYAALTAFVLALNGYPAGIQQLDPSQRPRLLNTYIEPQD